MPKLHFIVIELEKTEHDTFAGGFFLPFVRSVLEQTKVFREDRSGYWNNLPQTTWSEIKTYSDQWKLTYANEGKA